MSHLLCSYSMLFIFHFLYVYILCYASIPFSLVNSHLNPIITVQKFEAFDSLNIPTQSDRLVNCLDYHIQFRKDLSFRGSGLSLSQKQTQPCSQKIKIKKLKTQRKSLQLLTLLHFSPN